MLNLELQVANYGVSRSLSLLNLLHSYLYYLEPSVNLLFLVIHFLMTSSKRKFVISLVDG